MIDFRSDTITKPTQEMLDAMMNASVGDDVFMEDPSVNALEDKVAKMFGQESAIFCPSGTMCNQIAIKVHTHPGDEVICGDLAHVYHYEGGGMAMNSGVTAKLLKGDRGRFTANDIQSVINPDDVHKPHTSLVCVEDTSNKGGGAIWSHNNLKAIGELCQKSGMKYHLDGARAFNALIESGVAPEEYGKYFDSISICLSKGLGAPVGSVLIGDVSFIHQARRVRKVFGGGMRQAGFLAAAGIYALDNHVDRLKIDHQRAKQAGALLESLPYVERVLGVETNIVIYYLKEGHSVQAHIENMKNKNVLVIGMGGQAVRIVYHLDVTDSQHNNYMDILKKEF